MIAASVHREISKKYAKKFFFLMLYSATVLFSFSCFFWHSKIMQYCLSAFSAGPSLILHYYGSEVHPSSRGFRENWVPFFLSHIFFPSNQLQNMQWVRLLSDFNKALRTCDLASCVFMYLKLIGLCCWKGRPGEPFPGQKKKKVL